jgi:hypothetical protein
MQADEYLKAVGDNILAVVNYFRTNLRLRQCGLQLIPCVLYILQDVTSSDSDVYSYINTIY